MDAMNGGLSEVLHGRSAANKTLAEVCEFIVDCEHKTAPTQSEGVPSIRTPNIGPGRLILDGVNRVSEETWREWTRRAEPRAGDLIIAREAPVGNVAIVPPDTRLCLGQRTVLARPNPSLVDPSFLCYLMNGQEVQGAIHGKTNGATVPHLNLRDIRALRLPPIPGLPTQRRLALVPATIDDLIENNNRRVGVLENMTRALCAEWFVNFRYPGHRAGAGGLPFGWEMVPLGTLVTLARDTVTPNEEPDAKFELFSFEACDKDRIPILTRGSSILSNKFRVTEGAVLLPKLNPHIPRVWLPFFTGDRSICSTEYLVLRPRAKVPRTYVYAMLEGTDFSASVAARADGTSNSHKRLKPDDVLSRPVVKPPPALLEHFDSLAGSAYEACDKIRRRNQVLRKLRELLLPKLLSGEIDVSRLPLPPEEPADLEPPAPLETPEPPRRGRRRKASP